MVLRLAAKKIEGRVSQFAVRRAKPTRPAGAGVAKVWALLMSVMLLLPRFVRWALKATKEALVGVESRRRPRVDHGITDRRHLRRKGIEVVELLGVGDGHQKVVVDGVLEDIDHFVVGKIADRHGANDGSRVEVEVHQAGDVVDNGDTVAVTLGDLTVEEVAVADDVGLSERAHASRGASGER